jgi:ATP-dependent phosphoenolpyruvate carboxykinase
MQHWWNSLLSGEISTHVNSPRCFLIEKSLQKRRGILSSLGSLVIDEKEKNQSSSAQIYFVRDEKSESLINWRKKILSLSVTEFFELKTSLLKRIHLLKPEIFIFEGKIQIINTHDMGLNLISTSPVGAMFFNIMLKPQESVNLDDHYIVYHDPDLKPELCDVPLKSSSLMAFNLSTKEILMMGPLSMGEIQEGMLSLMSLILPQKGGLPIEGRGLKNAFGTTGLLIEMDKTQEEDNLIMDEFTFSGHDHFCLQGGVIQNLFEGAYLKGGDLNKRGNQELVLSYHRFGNMFEGILLDEKTRDPLIVTQNNKHEGHFIFSLPSFLEDFQEASGPSFLFLCYKDFSGVFPFVGRLEKKEALTTLLYVLHESPYALLHLPAYEHLLSRSLDCHALEVWFINTGFFRTERGEDKIKTKSLIRMTLREVMKKKGEFHFYHHPILSFFVPTHMDQVSERYLMPEKFWDHKKDYREVAGREKKQFLEKLQDVFKGVGDAF